MGCNHGNFWIGLGIGSILGAVAYRLSRTAKAKQIEGQICDAIQSLGSQAESYAENAQQKALNYGTRAVEKGARFADKVAQKADEVAGKAKDKWDK